MPAISKVCIIDDDPIFVFGILRFLKLAHLGEEFVHYANGKVALEGLQENLKSKEFIPDLIMVDLNMPVMDGWQFLEKYAKEDFPVNQLIFIVSSSIDPADRKRAEIFPFVSEFVVKPVSPTRLKELVSAYSSSF